MDETESCPYYVLAMYEKPYNLDIMSISAIIHLSINAILAITATLGNGMIVVAILRSQNLRTPSYLLITCLSFTDILVGLVCHPFQIFGIAFYWHKNLQGVCDMARPTVFITAFLGCISLTMVTCISIDRYLAVTLRHRYTIIVNKKRVKLVIVFLWIVAFLLSLLTTSENMFIPLLMLASAAALVLLSITCFCYIKSFRALHLYTVQVHAQQPNLLVAGNFDVVRYKKTLKTMLVVLGCLLLCRVPCVCSFVTLSLLGVGNMTMFFLTVSNTIFGLNSSINPIIYLVRLRDVRKACQETLKALFC